MYFFEEQRQLRLALDQHETAQGQVASAQKLYDMSIEDLRKAKEGGNEEKVEKAKEEVRVAEEKVREAKEEVRGAEEKAEAKVMEEKKVEVKEAKKEMEKAKGKSKHL